MKTQNNEPPPIPQKYPKFENGKYVWQSAFIDAFDYHYVLPGYVWDRLRCYDNYNGSSLFKEYKDYDTAMNDYYGKI